MRSGTDRELQELAEKKQDTGNYEALLCQNYKKVFATSTHIGAGINGRLRHKCGATLQEWVGGVHQG